MAVEMEMVVHPQPSWMREGNLVEMRAEEAGYEGSWFAVRILQLHYKNKGVKGKVCHQVCVEYCDFTKSDDSDEPLLEFVRKDQLRPLPPKLPPPARWKVGDAVETLYKHAWWIGFIMHYNVETGKYRVYYGQGQEALDLRASYIRARQEYVRPSGPGSGQEWTLARPMENPPAWEPAFTTVKGKVRKVPQTQPRERATPRRLVSDSDASWDEARGRREERRQMKRRRVTGKSAPAKPRAPSRSLAIKFSAPCNPIGLELATINAVPSKVSEQSIVCLTPGSSPPADSPLYDNATSSRLQTIPSSPSSGNVSGSGSGSEDEDEDEDEDGANSGDSEEVGDGRGMVVNRAALMRTQRAEPSIFQDQFSQERIAQDRSVYLKLLTRFRDSSKGFLDRKRHELLQGVAEELQLPREFCSDAHCQIFGEYMQVLGSY